MYPPIIVAPLLYTIPGQTKLRPILGIDSLELAQQIWLHAQSYYYAAQETHQLSDWYRRRGLARRRERIMRFEYVDDLLRYDCWE